MEIEIKESGKMTEFKRCTKIMCLTVYFNFCIVLRIFFLFNLLQILTSSSLALALDMVLFSTHR